MTLTVIEHAGVPFRRHRYPIIPRQDPSCSRTGFHGPLIGRKLECFALQGIRYCPPPNSANFIIPRRRGVGRERKEERNEAKESEIELGGFRINRLIKSIRTGIMEESGMEEEREGRKEWCGMVKKLLNEGAIEKKLAG